jgi:hypothetical protein
MSNHLAAIIRQLTQKTDAQVLHNILEGADFSEPAEGEQRSNAQMWAALLQMGADEREKWFSIMAEAAHEARLCFLKNHAGLEQEAAWWRDRSNGYAAAATVQKHEAETYYARMRKALNLAHYWRSIAKMAARESERLKRLVDTYEASDDEFEYEVESPRTMCVFCQKNLTLVNGRFRKHRPNAMQCLTYADEDMDCPGSGKLP